MEAPQPELKRAAGGGDGPGHGEAVAERASSRSTPPDQFKVLES